MTTLMTTLQAARPDHRAANAAGAARKTSASSRSLAGSPPPRRSRRRPCRGSSTAPRRPGAPATVRPSLRAADRVAARGPQPDGLRAARHRHHRPHRPPAAGPGQHAAPPVADRLARDLGQRLPHRRAGDADHGAGGLPCRADAVLPDLAPAQDLRRRHLRRQHPRPGRAARTGAAAGGHHRGRPLGLGDDGADRRHARHAGAGRPVRHGHLAHGAPRAAQGRCAGDLAAAGGAVDERADAAGRHGRGRRTAEAGPDAVPAPAAQRRRTGEPVAGLDQVGARVRQHRAAAARAEERAAGHGQAAGAAEAGAGRAEAGGRAEDAGRAVGRHGQARVAGTGAHPRPAIAVPRRAHRRAGPRQCQAVRQAAAQAAPGTGADRRHGDARRRYPLRRRRPRRRAGRAAHPRLRPAGRGGAAAAPVRAQLLPRPPGALRRRRRGRLRTLGHVHQLRAAAFAGRAGGVRHRAVVHRHRARRRSADGHRLPEDGGRHADLFLPRDPVLHLRGRADAARRHRGAHRQLRQPAGRPRARRPRHEQRARLHAVRRRGRLTAGRRVGDGLGDDPADEARGLRRRLRRQRDDARGAGRRADADLAQPHHLRARHRRHRSGERVQPDPRLPDPGAAADGLQPRRRLRSRPQTRLPDARRVPGLGRGVLGLPGGDARAAGHRHHPGRHPERRVHGHRVGRHGRLLGAAGHRCRLPVVELEGLPGRLREGLQDHRRRAAADRHLIRLRLLHGAVRGAAEDRRMAGADERQQRLADLPVGERAAVRAGHVPGHGGHHPDLHADLPAHLHEGRHGPDAVRRRHAPELRARPEHAAGG
ncbi:unnamed protein product [Rotaria sp. Silwood1]|nr:unnamed protein product [Rotaria sp. Silwood1]